MAESWRTQRARLASLTRHRAEGDPEVQRAARDLAVTRLEDHIRRVVDQAPPLTEAQRSRLAVLLTAPSGERAAG